MNGTENVTIFDTLIGFGFVSSWTESVGPMFVSQLWQVTLAILLAGFFSLRWGSRFPSIAYGFWILVIVKVLMPPVWSSPAGMFTWLDTARTSWPQESSESLLPRFDSPSRAGVDVLTAQTHNDVLASYSRADLGQDLPIADPTPVWKKWLIANGTAAILAVWLAGAIGLSLFAIAQWFRLWRQMRQSRSAPPDWLQAELEDVRKVIGFPREVRVRINTFGFGPLVMGHLRPTIVLPSALVERSSAERLRPILAHELVHAKRGDTWISGFQFLATIVWWFHPLVWWGNRQMNRWCEQSCDAEAINRLRCRPEEYAHALLDVLELKRKVRPLPACAGVRAVDLTRRRLEAIMSRGGVKNLRSTWWQWALLGLGALILLPGAKFNLIDRQPTHSEPIAYDNVQSLRVRANTAFQAGAWENAADSYGELCETVPDDALAWFRRGYALHALGRMEEALEAHQTAAKFSSTKPIALYNWACALALLNRPDAAMVKLEEAIEVGFRSRFPIQNDPDLKILLNESRFRDLAELALAPNAFTGRSQFDFWIGRWDVFDKSGKLLGTNVISKREGGHLLVEKWQGETGVTGTSMNYYDPEHERWKQTWVDSKGSIIELVGSVIDGKVKMSGRFVNRQGHSELSRMTIIPMPNGQVQQLIEKSDDDGDSWETYFEGTYVRTTVKREEASVSANG